MSNEHEDQAEYPVVATKLSFQSIKTYFIGGLPGDSKSIKKKSNFSVGKNWTQ